jgi:hypothetical protein
MRRSDVKLIAVCAALLTIVAACGGTQGTTTPRLSSANHVTSDRPATGATRPVSAQPTCKQSKPPVAPLDVRKLRKPTKIFDGQVLLYPPRDHDEPAVDAAAALHPHDGAGNSFPAVYGGAVPALSLVRFTYTISIENPKPLVDRLAWIVLSNCVPLVSEGPGPLLSTKGPEGPPMTRRPVAPMIGYNVTVVDATSGLALMTFQAGPPLDVAQIGA